MYDREFCQRVQFTRRIRIRRSRIRRRVPRADTDGTAGDLRRDGGQLRRHVGAVDLVQRKAGLDVQRQPAAFQHAPDLGRVGQDRGDADGEFPRYF